jgi:hypothetical protein
MPAIDPKSLPANLQPGAPARNLTPQEMRMAVAQMKAPRVEERPPVGFVEEAPPQMPMSPNRRFSPPGRSGISRQYAKGGSVSSASKRADGCITKGHTKGMMR